MHAGLLFPDSATKKLLSFFFKEIAPLFANRAGGYTRVLKREERRLGDGGQTAFLELVLESRTNEVNTSAPVIIDADVKK